MSFASLCVRGGPCPALHTATIADLLCLFARLTDAVALAMEQWGTQHHVFIVETFLKNGYCVVKMQ
jgi:hypothetical protein